MRAERCAVRCTPATSRWQTVGTRNPCDSAVVSSTSWGHTGKRIIEIDHAKPRRRP